jgi:YD repeat-containing protein
LTYDSQGRLSVVTAATGQTLQFFYDAANLVQRVTHPAGQDITYTHDTNQNLTSVTFPDLKTKQYLYENAVDPNWLTGIQDENTSRYATFAYSAGKATSSSHAGGADLWPPEPSCLNLAGLELLMGFERHA